MRLFDRTGRTRGTTGAAGTGAPPGSALDSTAGKLGLRGEVTLWGAIALSIGFMGPTLAMNLNPAGTAAQVGRAVPLAFIAATIGVALVAYSFIRLTQRFHHAGSVYGFVGITLGPRSGFLAGWAMLLTYVAYTITAISACAIFGSGFLAAVGVRVDWLVVAIVVTPVLALLAVNEIRLATRALLGVEGLSVALIVIIGIVVLAKLLRGTAPDGQTITMSVFTPEPGSSFNAFALAIVFGFLSFAGFEAAASLGEETANPRRDIPRAIAGTLVFAALFFVFCVVVQSMGFGTTKQGVDAYAGSESLFGDLAKMYIGQWASDVVLLGAAVAAFGSALGVAVAGSRLVFAMGRDGMGENAFVARTSRSGAPVVAASLILLLALSAIVLLRIFVTYSATDIFFWSAAVGTLPLLVAYVLNTIGAIRLLFVKEHHLPRWEVVIPIAGLFFLVFTLYKNVYPPGERPYDLFPYVVAGWLILGVALLYAVPSVAAAVGRGLAGRDGLSASESVESRD
jgi:amino acid transporter